MVPSFHTIHVLKAFKVDLVKEETFDIIINATENSSKKFSIEKNTNFKGIVLKIML